MSAPLVSLGAASAKSALDSIPFAIRLQTHRPGSNAPVGLYQDTACITQALLPGAPVRALRDDLATGAIVFSNPNSTATLQFVNGVPVVRFPGDANGYLRLGTAGSPLAASLANLTTIIRYQARYQADGVYGKRGIFAAGDSNDRDVASGNGFFWGTDQFNANGTTDTHWKQAGLSTSAITVGPSLQTAYVDGIPVGSLTASGNPQGSAAYFLIGARTVFGPIDTADCDVEAVILANNLTASNRELIFSALGRSAQPPVICTGDSITQGILSNLGVNPAQDYPSRLKALRPNAEILNDGGWGNRIADLVTRRPTTLGMLYGSSGIVVVEIGTNDLADGTSAATVQAALWSYCDSVQASGATVYVCTVLPRDTTGLVAGFESARGTLNASIRANFSTHAAGVIDIGAQGTGIGWDGSTGSNPADSTTYYLPDKTHLNPAGCTILANLVDKVIPNRAQGSGNFAASGGNTDITSLVLPSPDGTKYKVTVANGGALTTTAV